jgi:nuclear transport factor 2 (NTF2) superfamily protein
MKEIPNEQKLIDYVAGPVIKKDWQFHETKPYIAVRFVVEKKDGDCSYFFYSSNGGDTWFNYLTKEAI